jgi:hypothetical protein
MTKRKASGAGRKKMPAHLVRKSKDQKTKSVPLSGPKDPVMRSIPKKAPALANRQATAAKPVETQGEGSLSIFDAQMRLFQSMLRLSPLGYFMRAQDMIREETSKPQDRS